MKSPKVVESKKMSRIGLLSLVTWMVVSLSAGTALAADFTLRKVDKDGVVGDEVKGLELQQEKDAKELLTTVSTDAKSNVEKYVELFSKEPTQFVEGIAAAVKSVKEVEKRAELKKSLAKDLEKVLASAYGVDKDALLKIVEKLMAIDDKNLDKLTRVELLKELFAGKTELLAKLALSEKDKTVAKKDEPKNVEEKKADRVGEVMTDAQVTELAQKQCDQVNGVLDRVNDKLATISNAINEGYNRLKEMSKLAQVAPAPKKEQAEDIIPQLMKELMEKNKAPQHAQPAAPQVASAPEKEEAPAKNSVLDNPLPQPQQQQQQSMPFMPQTQVASSPNIPEFSPDLPANTGAALAIRRGQDAAALGEEALTAGVPSLTNQFTGRALDPITAAGTLGAAKTTTENALTSVSQELKNANNRLSQLTQVRDRLKNDPANTVPEELKRLKSDKEQALAKAKEVLKAKNDQLQPMTQSAMMSGGDPRAMMEAQMQVKMMSAQETAAVAQAQSELDAVLAKENLVKSKAKPELATYESQIVALEDTVSDLKAQKTKLDSQKQQIAQMLTANAQQALASSQPQSPNVYNRFGNQGNVPTTGRGLGNALNPTRGALGGSVGLTR